MFSEPEPQNHSSFANRMDSFRSRWDAISVRAVAILTAAMGVVNVSSATMPAVRERLRLLEQFSPLEVTRGSRLATVLAGFALLLLSSNLWRRKQAAWLLAIAVLVASALSHLLKGLDYEEASIAVLLALFIFSLRSHFHARSDVPSVRQGIRVLFSAALFTLAYGTVGFYLVDRHFKARFELIPALTQTLAMFTEFATPGLQPVTRFGRYFADSIYIIAGATLSYGFFMLVRPVLIRQPATAEERNRAREIVEAHGRTPLARMTLFDDKSYFFGKISLGKGFAVSSNTILVQAVYENYKSNPKQFTDRIDNLGLNTRLHLPFRGEGIPFVPHPSDKTWNGLSLPWMAFGYGISITPLQTLTLYNAVANNGVMVKPMFVSEIKEWDKTIKKYDTQIINPKICSDNTLKKLKVLLQNVVKYGTGKKMYSKDFSMAGKTGTAQANYADQKLKDYISDKLQKLVKFYPKILQATVYLKLENSGQVKAKVIEVKLNVPGSTLIATNSDKSFEASFDDALENVKRQLKKLNDKAQEAR